ncbi:MAG: FG-GAP repeat domain-containing protein [Candidatus Aphodosoma sp.]
MKKIVSITLLVALFVCLTLLFVVVINKKLEEIPQKNVVLTSMKINDTIENQYDEEEIVEEVVDNEERIELLYSDTIYGDFNGDGKKESLFFVSDTLTDLDFIDEYVSYQGAYTSVFSDKRIPKFETIANWIGPLHILGDLNGDGRDEIGIYTSYFSAWGAYKVMSFNGSEWVELIGSYPLHYYVFDVKGRNFRPVIKHLENKVKIYYSEYDNIDGDIKLKTKVVEIKLLEENKGKW